MSSEKFSASNELTSEPIGRKQHFLRVAIQSLVRNGGIATIQADYIKRLLAAMNLDAEFTILPGQTSIFMKEDISPSQGVNVLTFKTGLGYNLDKLEDVEAVLCDAMAGKIFGGMDQALASLERINKRSTSFGPWIHPVGWSLIGGITTMLLRGNFVDAGVALGTGLVFGLALLGTEYYAPSIPVFDFGISFVVAFILALVQALALPTLHFWPTFLASVILILPGFSMAMGFTDVFAKQIAFGLTTLFNAAWTALNIGLGAFLGFRSVGVILSKPDLLPLDPTNVAQNPWYLALALYPVFNVLLNATFQAKKVQCFIISAFASVAFALCELLGRYGFSDEANILLCCLAMGVLGQVHGRVAGTTELATTLSGIIVFAPGTYGARSAFYAILAACTKDLTIAGLTCQEYAFRQAACMLTISASMAGGLLLTRAIFNRF